MIPDFLHNPAEQVADQLLGCLLERTFDGNTILARIVETESYDQGDPASHSFRGPTPRNEIMFGEAGRLYVYFTYGMHFCANVVTGAEGRGEAVLIRAVEPLEGLETMERIRGVPGFNATNGPAKLCQALAIDLELNGHDLRQEPLRLLDGDLSGNESVTTTTRIGISKAADLPRRHYLSDNPWVSRR